jgi:hypothetical protein
MKFRSATFHFSVFLSVLLIFILFHLLVGADDILPEVPIVGDQPLIKSSDLNLLLHLELESAP